jgi:tRNA threonylcarbamoyladenosine biosynthesis protein TsaB
MLLAIDTATRQLSLALHTGQSVLAEYSWHTAHYHTVELAPQIAILLRRASVEPGHLKGLAVALGPGSYTGLRIGLGLAKGLAFAHNTPLLGVPTFDILMRAQAPRPERVVAVLAAGRGRFITAAYYWDGKGWKADGGPRVMEASELAADVVEPTVICGEWEGLTPEQRKAFKGRAVFDSPARSLRRAGYLAEIGWERLQAGRADDPLSLAPIYAGQPEGMSA